MHRRTLLSSAVVTTAVSLLGTTSAIVPTVVAAAERKGYRALVLKDVPGWAKAVIKKDWYKVKEYDHLKFEGDFYITKIIFYDYYIIVVGVVDGKVWDPYSDFVFYFKDYFKAKADLYKKDDDDDYEHNPYLARYPHDHEDCELILDIGRFKIKKPFEYYYGSKGKSYDDKKLVIIITIDPDPAELEVKDKRLKKILCEKADKYDDYDYDDKKGEALSLQ